MKVTVSPDAERELMESAVFYAERADSELGLAFITEFERALDLLSAIPELGASWRRSRRLSLRRFPFYVVYQLTAEEIRVIALAHQRRRPGYWAGRK